MLPEWAPWFSTVPVFIMKKHGFLLFLIIAVFILTASFIFKNAFASDATSDGVYNIYVSNESYYLVDTRFGLCFYHTKSGVTRIPCVFEE